MQHVLVYGTLRAGEVNDINRATERHGIAQPEKIGAAHVSGRLFDFGTYPGLVLDEAGEPVRGDVYLIEDALVPVLDEIEEVYPGVEGLFRAHRLHIRGIAQRCAAAVDCLIYPVAATAMKGLPRIVRRGLNANHADRTPHGHTPPQTPHRPKGGAMRPRRRDVDLLRRRARRLAVRLLVMHRLVGRRLRLRVLHRVLLRLQSLRTLLDVGDLGGIGAHGHALIALRVGACDRAKGIEQPGTLTS